MDDPGPTRMSFTLLTMAAAGHPIMGRMHGPEDEKRSVVVLDGEERNNWLNAARVGERARHIDLFDGSDFETEPAPRG